MALSDREKDIIRSVLAVLASERLRLTNEEATATVSAIKHQDASRQLKDAYDDLRRLLKDHENDS